MHRTNQESIIVTFILDVTIPEPGSNSLFIQTYPNKPKPTPDIPPNVGPL